MATHDYVIANGTGAAVRSDLNGALAAIVSQNSSATEPSPSYAYQRWADTTAGVMKMRNGANNAWITLYQLDGEWSTIAFENGTAAAPSIYFKDSGTDTGIYSPGADQVAISTGGVQRINIEADGDINIDGGGVFYDAINNRLGIGTSSPEGPLHVMAASSATGAIIQRWGYTVADQGTYDLTLKTGSSSGIVKYNFSMLNNGTSYNDVLVLDRGKVGIGTSSPAYQVEVSTDSAGKPSTNTWTIVSDERIKEEIELADLDLCYQAVKNIPLKRFKWKDEVYTEEQVRDRRKLGWIAQDVEAVFPKAVGTYEFKYNQVFEETIISAVEEELDADGNVTTPARPERIEQGDLISEDVIEDCRDLNSDQLYAAMYGAVQKLMAKVETLEASNTELLARLSAIEGA